MRQTGSQGTAIKIYKSVVMSEKLEGSGRRFTVDRNVDWRICLLRKLKHFTLFAQSFHMCCVSVACILFVFLVQWSAVFCVRASCVRCFCLTRMAVRMGKTPLGSKEKQSRSEKNTCQARKRTPSSQSRYSSCGWDRVERRALGGEMMMMGGKPLNEKSPLSRCGNFQRFVIRAVAHQDGVDARSLSPTKAVVLTREECAAGQAALTLSVLVTSARQQCCSYGQVCGRSRPSYRADRG